MIGTAGRVETFNPAAERILGLEPGEAAGRGFGELFIARAGFDEFTQLVLDVVGGQFGGERRVVEVENGGKARSLSVATSYLKAERDGATRTVAAIAVFNDISELRELGRIELRVVPGCARMTHVSRAGLRAVLLCASTFK